jgi:epoxyqueuosine reductase QueG
MLMTPMEACRCGAVEVVRSRGPGGLESVRSSVEKICVACDVGQEYCPIGKRWCDLAVGPDM